MMKAVEMQRKESGESHSSEELQTKLTEILIETLYRFEGSEEMKNLQMHLENCTGKNETNNLWLFISLNSLRKE